MPEHPNPCDKNHSSHAQEQQELCPQICCCKRIIYLWVAKGLIGLNVPAKPKLPVKNSSSRLLTINSGIESLSVQGLPYAAAYASLPQRQNAKAMKSSTVMWTGTRSNSCCVKPRKSLSTRAEFLSKQAEYARRKTLSPFH